jgi:hypothetical protein
VLYAVLWSENPKGRDHSEDLGIYKKILERIVGKSMRRYELDTPGSGLGLWAGSCEHANERSGYIKGREFDGVTVSFAKRTQLHVVS